MTSIGEQLKEAREAKGVSPSEAAESTRIKVQLIRFMEENAFESMGAPIYVKGFIKLYAQYLEVDAAPLVQCYKEQYMPSPKKNHAEEKGEGLRDESSEKRPRVPASLPSIPWKPEYAKVVFLVVGAVLILVLLISGIRNCSGGGNAEATTETDDVERTLQDAAIMEGAPEPYLPQLNE